MQTSTFVFMLVGSLLQATQGIKMSPNAATSNSTLVKKISQEIYDVKKSVVTKGDVAVCPGESDRYGDHKCNHDPTHRVCAQLLDGSGKPLAWGSDGTFWDITGQTAVQWDDQIRANNGDSWCICMWATADLIQRVGCDSVHLHCEATDVAYMLKKYTDEGMHGTTDLAPAKECMKKKCPTFVVDSLPTPKDKVTDEEKKARATEAKGGATDVLRSSLWSILIMVALNLN